MAEWLAMGGYGWYVWPSYGIFAAVIAVNWYTASRAQRDAVRRAKRRRQRHSGQS